MTNNRIAILVDIKTLKNEAKTIQKKNHKNTIPYTKILNYLITALGFKSFNEYEQFLHKKTEIKTTTFDKINIEDLKSIKENLIRDFKKENLMIENIYFIDNEIKLKINQINKSNGFSMSLYLYTLPYLLGNGNIKCIDINTSMINKDNLKILLNLVYNNYDSKSLGYERFYFLNNEYKTKNFFDIYEAIKISNIHIKENTEYLKEDSKRELFFAIYNHYNEKNYKEGLVFEKLNSLNKGLKSIENIIEEIQEEINKELIFINKFNYNFNISTINKEISIPDFSPPINQQKYILDAISEINNNFTESEPLILGQKITRNQLFKKTEYLKISKNEICENIFIAGCAGSGVSAMSYSYVLQALKSGSGFVYINFKGDSDTLNTLHAISKLTNREKDVTILSINHKAELNNINIKEIVKKNKILIISSPALERLSQEAQEEILNTINNMFSKINEYKKNIFPFTFIINDFFFSRYTEYDRFLNQIKRLNKLNIAFIGMDHDFTNVNKNKIDTVFNNIMIFKVYDSQYLQNFNFKRMDFRDFRSLGSGEFFMIKNKEIIEKKYKCFYIVPKIEDFHDLCSFI